MGTWQKVLTGERDTTTSLATPPLGVPVLPSYMSYICLLYLDNYNANKTGLTVKVQITRNTVGLGWVTCTHAASDLLPGVVGITGLPAILEGDLIMFQVTFSSVLGVPKLKGVELRLYDVDVNAIVADQFEMTYDMAAYVPNHMRFLWDASKNIDVFVRGYDNGEPTTGAWTLIDSNDDLLDGTPYGEHYVDVAMKFPSTHALITPEEIALPVMDFDLEGKDIKYPGVWTSNALDVTKVQAPETGVYQLNSNMDGSLITVQSRSSVDGVAWSPWYTAVHIANNLNHPATIGGTKVNFIQIRLIINYIGDMYDGVITGLAVAFAPNSESTPIMTDISDAPCTFALLNNSIVIANGTIIPQAWNGVDDPEDITAAPPNLKGVVTWNNRVWGIDGAYESIARWCDIYDVTTWDALNSIQFNEGDGDRLNVIYPFGDTLVFSKGKSMALLSGNSEANFSLSWIDTPYGATGQNAICAYDRSLVYVAQDGIRITDTVTTRLLSENLKTLWEDTITFSALVNAAIVRYGNKIYVALPSKGSTQNNTVWAYDVLRGAWTVYDGWCVSAWVKVRESGEESLYMGDSHNASIYELMDVDFDDSVRVEYEWQSKTFDCGCPERYKVFRNVFLDIEGISEDAEITVDLIVDGVSSGNPFKDTIPKGVGVKHTRRILPPLHDAVLGRNIAFNIKTSCGVQSIILEYVVRGLYPGGVM